MKDEEKDFDQTSLTDTKPDVQWALTREERVDAAIRILGFIDLSGSNADLNTKTRLARAEAYLLWINDIARSTGISKSSS